MSKDDATYTVAYDCSNCFYHGPVTFQKGQPAPASGVVCPHCGIAACSKSRKREWSDDPWHQPSRRLVIDHLPAIPMNTPKQDDRPYPHGPVKPYATTYCGMSQDMLAQGVGTQL